MKVVLILSLFAAQIYAAQWRDPSPHEVRFVTVEQGVRLEVLDWGGSGREVVLLTGSGNTAHVYDVLAEKLADCCHVYAITRRGFGHSSHPESGYGDRRLAADVLAVLDALRIEAPVLVGHSMAGAELTTLGRQHSSRLAGLVYLDAGADPKDFPWSDPAYRAAVEKMQSLKTPGTQRLRANRKKSFAAYREWQLEQGGFAFCEAEVRNMYHFHADGSIGDYRTPNRLRQAIDAGAVKRNYAGIRAPVLSIFAMPKPPADRWSNEVPEYRAAAEAEHTILLGYLARYKKSLTDAVPGARVLEWSGASHYLYLTQEEEVLRELRAFAGALEPPSDGRR